MSDFGFQLKAALVGDFDRELEAGLKRTAQASLAAMDDTSGDALSRLRLDVSVSRLRNGGKLAKTWRRRLYPNAGLNPVAVIRSAAPLIVSAFEEGAEIRSPSGLWLAIPNPALRIKAKRRRGGRSVIGDYEARFGPLRMVFLKGRRDLALLVTDLRRSKGARGGFRKPTDAARARGDFEETVVFYLVPKARAPKLLHGATIRQRLERDFPVQYQRRFDIRLAETERGPLRISRVDGAE